MFLSRPHPSGVQLLAPSVTVVSYPCSNERDPNHQAVLYTHARERRARRVPQPRHASGSSRRHSKRRPMTHAGERREFHRLRSCVLCQSYAFVKNQLHGVYASRSPGTDTPTTAGRTRGGRYKVSSSIHDVRPKKNIDVQGNVPHRNPGWHPSCHGEAGDRGQGTGTKTSIAAATRTPQG